MKKELYVHAIVAVAGAALILFVGSLAWADATPPMLSIDSGASSATYHLVHKLHRFDATSKKVEGKARILPTGQAQVAIRVPVESFDSGNANRDEHMKETVEAARFPTVELKAMGEGVTMPVALPSTVEKPFTTQVTFHGVQKTITVPVKLTFEPSGRVLADTSFSVSLDAFKIERPSLMFVKIDDEMKIDAHVVLNR